MQFLTFVLTVSSLGSTLAVPVGETRSNPRTSDSSSDGTAGLRIPSWVGPLLGGGIIGAAGNHLYSSMKGHERRRTAATPPPPVQFERFRLQDYKDYGELFREVTKRAETSDLYGFNYIFRCAMLRDSVNWRDSLEPESTRSSYEEALGSCAQQYFDWVAEHGPADESRLPMPTIESEQERARQLREQKHRRVVGEQGEGGAGPTDITPLQFAGMKLPGLRNGVNLVWSRFNARRPRP